MGKARTYNTSNWMHAMGSWWIFFPSLLILGVVISVTVRDYGMDFVWVYFFVGLGSVPAALLFLLERPYPFDGGGGSLLARFPRGLCVEDRKLLTYWKTSREVDRFIWKYAMLLFLLIALIPAINLVCHCQEKAPVVDIVMLSSSPINFFLHFLFSWSFYHFILSRHLLKKRVEIGKMAIEPWPEDKLYVPGPLVKYKVAESEAPSSIFTALMHLDPQTPFNWNDFFMLICFFAGIPLLNEGLKALFSRGLLAILHHPSDLFRVGVPVVLLLISSILWQRKYGDKDSKPKP